MKKYVKVLFSIYSILFILIVVSIISKDEPDMIGKIFVLLFGFTFSLLGIIGIVKLIRKWKNKVVVKLEKNYSDIEILQSKFKLEVVVFDELENYIKKNESKIIEKDEKKLHEFIKLTRFLKSIKSEIESNLKKGQTDLYFVKDNLKKLIKETKFLNSKLEQIYILGQLMVEKYVNNEMVEFYTIYEKFDELGTFNSSYENKMLSNLNSLSSQLDSIQNSLNYSNVLLTYNTLQLRGIKKTLNK